MYNDALTGALNIVRKELKVNADLVKNEMNDQIAGEFNKWVDRVLSDHPIEVAAYNFNLYEHHCSFAIQLIGATRFDGNDPTWVCDEAFSSREDLFELPHQTVGQRWEDGLAAAKQLVVNYARLGAQREKLNRTQRAGVGFVDGDLHLVLVGDR